MIDWLQKWFINQCDSEWEHGSGIRIDTIDNPGWSIQIDLNGTNVLVQEQEWILLELSAISWIGYKIEDNIYFGSGDPLKLKLLIQIFKMIIEKGAVHNSYIIEEMEKDKFRS